MGFSTDQLFDNHKCLECGYNCTNRRALGNHIARSHKQLNGVQEYVLKHFLKGEIPVCVCGCGEQVKWHKTLYMFNDYITGHNPAGFRVKQPKFSAEQLEKRAQKIRETYSSERGDEIKKRISESLQKRQKTQTDN